METALPNQNNHLKSRLILMSFLQYAVWGAYLTCMGKYLVNSELDDKIGLFYAMQGIVSMFMPALMGIVADRWIPAQKTLSLCHFISGGAMILASFHGINNAHPDFGTLFTLYSIGVSFYIPTIALSNSVTYNALEKGGLDTIKDFPPIRVFGTIGFIAAMWAIDLLQLSETPYQFMLSGALGIMLAAYSITMPNCPTSNASDKKSFAEALGLQAFKLFKIKKMAIFFIFSMCLGAALQVTSSFATPFISSFGVNPEFEGTFGVKHSVIIYSISQISETICILLIPFFLRRFGIKNVMLMAMLAWVLRFGLFGIGDPGSGLWAIILSMIVYGFAFDFYNISGSLFVNQETDPSMRSSAQGLFMLMTNGLGATLGMFGAQAVVNTFCQTIKQNDIIYLTGDWQSVWFIFAAYALVIAVLFAIFFRYKHERK
ncbi:MAG: MFS transporter [Bacteroidales bacterium]|nr:MFS transporter [Bacteroidales bacterium]